jgi:glycosyltransferase involved in cell wall biosynthesis
MPFYLAVEFNRCLGLTALYFMLKIDIYWDLRSTIPERHTGVGKHVIEVLNGLRARSDCVLRVLLAKDQVVLWAAQSEAHGWAALEVVVLPLTNKGNRFLYGLTSTWSLDRICAGRDLVYSPMEMLLGLKQIPFVNTIHGVPCFEKSLPRHVYQSARFRWERVKQAWFLRRSRQLCRLSLPVSDYLSDQLVDRFQFDPAMLHPVYNGAGDCFFESPPAGRASTAKRRPRFLSVGGANAFDGGAALVRIARVLQREMPEAKLWIAGDCHREPWRRQLRAMDNVVWHGFLSSERMIVEMRRASALLYVPAVESFGIIGVEAMALGLPIVARPSTALPEVLGDAAVWIDPDNPASVVQGLKAVVEDEPRREELIATGRQRAQRYRWSNVVERVIAGFQRALAG